MEIFDLVEEMGTTTFYQLLDVSQDASASDIRRAYRKKSLQFHPDKNKEDGAEEVFRQIATVAEILRDEEKRAIYDRVLVEGLPNWQQPVYYYRQVRRMGTVEVLIALFIIMTVVHYGYLCAVFLDQYYQAEIDTLRRKRKSKKGKGDDGEGDQITARTPFPGPLSVLPVVLVRGAVTFIIVAPSMWRHWKEDRQRRQEEIERLAQEEAERRKQAEEDAVRAAETKVRRVQYKLQQKQDALQDVTAADNIDWGRIPNVAEMAVEEHEPEDTAPKRARAPWTEDEITDLTKAFVRFPGGTLNRWEKIAAEVGRSVSEVTTQVKQLKSRAAKVNPSGGAGSGLESSKRAAEASNRLTKDITLRTDGGEETASAPASSSVPASHQWTQDEQKLLERALAKYGRDVEDRWKRIADAVPGKSKEECMLRYKHIALQLRQRKPASAAAKS